MDNVFDVAALLEDAETKNSLLEHIEQLQKLNTQVDKHDTSTTLERMGIIHSLWNIH